MMKSTALDQGRECRLAGLAKNSSHSSSFFFPSGEVTISPVLSSVVKPSEMCLGGGVVHFQPALIKQEPVDFSVSNFNTCVTREKISEQARISVPPDIVIFKTEASTLPCNHTRAETFVSTAESPNVPGRICNSIGVPVNTSSAIGENATELHHIGLPPTSSCLPLSSTDALSKVPVMRICRQNSSSFFTTTSNCNVETVPLKALPTSNNVERVYENNPIAPLSVNNGEIILQNPGLRTEGVANEVMNAPRKARLKFSPRIRRSENILVPVHSFFPKTGDPSLSVGDKENVNAESDQKEKNVVYQWDMSAFPKCVVQLKKLPLKMETMFLSRSSQEHTKQYCASPGDDDDSKEFSFSQKNSPSDVSDSSKFTESNGENGFFFEDGRKKKRSIEPREKTRCSFCGMLTLSADVWRHLLAVYKVKDDLKNEVIENQETLVCGFCGAGLCSEVALSIHTHHLHSKKEFEAKYKCIVCEEKFPTETHLALHLQKHYSKQQEELSRQPRKARPSTLVTEPNSISVTQYECLICKKRFQSYQALNAHKKLHRRQPIQECNICGKKFTKSYKLKCHMVVHTDERPFKCTECGKSFRFKSSLRSHKFFHLGVNPYKCKYCNQGFLEGGNLLKHIRRTHQGHRSEICNICGKVFTDKQALKYHMRLHTNIHQKRTAFGSASSAQSDILKSRERNTTSSVLVSNAVDVTDSSTPIENKMEVNKDQTLSVAGQSSYENSVLFHLLTSPQRDKQKDGNPEAQQVVDLYEWSESTTDTTSEHDSGMNSPPQTQRECLLCDMTFNTIQKLKKHLLSYHRINPGKLQRLIG